MKNIVRVISSEEESLLEKYINKAIEEQENKLYKLISVSSPCVTPASYGQNGRIVVILTFVKY